VTFGAAHENGERADFPLDQTIMVLVWLSMIANLQGKVLHYKLHREDHRIGVWHGV
jgi:hypothetical protein